MSDPVSRPRMGVAFLLAQLGADAANQFAAALASRHLTPALAGVMRLLNAESGLSQLQLADKLGTAPSRIVSYLDDLESRGWVSRSRDTTDRRVNVLRLTTTGKKAFRSITATAMQHDATMTESLDDAEYHALHELLNKLSVARNLTPGVHPGYRNA